MRQFIAATLVALISPLPLFARETERTIGLDEVTVTANRRNVLYSVGYLREFSELTTGGDTVFMFREKWVDFMTPSPGVKRFAGWHAPRVLTSKSYYRFSNGGPTDSVSDRFNQHFSWSDWVRIPARVPLPKSMTGANSTDTVFGRYRPTEIWRRNDDRIRLSVNVLAHPESRRWVPGLDDFFARGVDFERFDVDYYFRAVSSDVITESNLEMMSFNIESNGRGRNMFKFNRPREPFSVRTYAELYIADRRNLSLSEAKRIEARRPVADELAALMPSEIAPLSPEIRALVSRVESIDHTAQRLKTEPDENLVGLSLVPLTRNQRFSNWLRGLVGISRKGIRAKKYER